MTLRFNRPRARRRWALLGAIVMALSLAGVAVVQAQLDKTLFELDKDASSGNTFTNDAGLPGKIGVLNAAVAASAGPTAITICQDRSAFYNGAKILVNAERMTLADGSNGTGGGCPSDFSFKRNYNATRGVDGTTPGAHSKAEDVSRFAAASPAADDWNDVYASISADGNDEGDDDKCIALGAVECVFVHDLRAMSIFTQSKDYDEISDDGGATVFWKWRDQSVPDADELDDGFAIKYVDENDEQHVFFGADRFATNGTKDAGFWFFHDEVTTGGPLIGTDGTFTGVHTAPVDGDGDGFCNPAEGGLGGPQATPNCARYDSNDTGGDVLILTSFSQGGATVTARVFEWIGPAGSTAALLERSTSADCVPGNPGQSVCATVNNTTVESGTFGAGLWPYSGKSEPATNEIPSGGLLEGGVNLTDLGLEGCFSSFMATSRSSDSLTADPKDFILGSFEACDTEVTTTPSDGSGTALTDSDTPPNGLPDTLIGAGSAGVNVTDNAAISVTGLPTWTGTVSFFICGPITSPALCDTGGVAAGTKNVSNTTTTATSDSVNLTSVGRYCWRGVFTPSVASAAAGLEPATDARASECFEVKPRLPVITTQATTAVEISGQISDTAFLSGTANQPGTNGGTTPGQDGSQYPTINATNGAAAGGTITFRAYGPNDSTCAGTPAFTSSEVTVSGDNTTTGYGPVSFTPTATGTYRWIASYSGNPVNTLGRSGACNDANETSIVVDAKISIAEDATNEINDPHTFTITVQQDAGDGNGFVNVPDGTTPSVTLTATNGAVLDLDTDACADPGTVSGQCTVTFTSASAGTITGHAAVTLSVGGVTVMRETDGLASNSDDAVKVFVDARISIAEDDTNEVGDPHTFTITVEQDAGDGNGFVNAPNDTPVSVTLTDSNGAAQDISADTCADPGTVDGQCTITFTSDSAGTITGHASVTFDVGVVSLTRATDGQAGNSDDAVKVFVDAYITIGEDATNTVGDPHTFTVNVFQDDGRAADDPDGDGVDGFGPAPDETFVTITLTDSEGAQNSVSSDTCGDPTNLVDPAVPGGGTVNGACTITFTSPTAGTVTGHASVTFVVGGVSLTRSTDGQAPNSDDAVKIFVAGSIAWTKVDNGDRLQGGATFELCLTNTYILPDGGIDEDNPLDPPDCRDVVDNGLNDEDPVAGQFLVSGLALGRYTVEETEAPAGYVPDPKTETVDLVPGDTDITIELAFVNSRPILKITGFGYTNAPDGVDPQPDGIFKGTTTYTVNLHNYGTAAAELSNSSLLVSDNATCEVSNTLAITGTIAVDADGGPYTLTCTYDVPDPAVITATLAIKYTTNGLERTASGSPATITFTVSPD